jgi:translation initiation factor IF-3
VWYTDGAARRPFRLCFLRISAIVTPVIVAACADGGGASSGVYGEAEAIGGRGINRDFRGDNRPRETRVNERVRAREVRLIDEDGQAIGIMTSMQALNLARERGLDLVEVSPMAVPPVCRLMDWGRYKYEQAKKENEARKHQKTVELKEIRMRPRTDEHDLGVKVRKIEEFLAEGDKVKVSVVFRGREMAHPELGRVVLDKVASGLKGVGQLERAPIMEGRMISMIVSRAPGWEPPKRAATAPPRRGEQPIEPADGLNGADGADGAEAGTINPVESEAEAAAPPAGEA